MLDHPNYNCRITTDTGKTHLVYANWMHNQGLDHWQGWRCDSGHTRFHIDKNFEIWGGECRNDHLGSVLGDWNIKPNSVCARETCTGCTDDLIAPKHRPSV
jgi:hypothetical protein